MTTSHPSPLVADPYTQPTFRRRHGSYGRQRRDLQDLTSRLIERATAYRVKVSSEKRTNISVDISMNGEKVQEVISFNYCKDGICSAEVLISIGPAMARRNRIWRCKAISFASMFNLYKFLGKMHVCVYGEGRGVREASDSR